MFDSLMHSSSLIMEHRGRRYSLSDLLEGDILLWSFDMIYLFIFKNKIQNAAPLFKKETKKFMFALGFLI